MSKMNTITAKRLGYLTRRSREKIQDAVEDTIRGWQAVGRQQAEVVNEKEIRVLGLRRSGNHAVINWICKQLPENHVFINHSRIKENPYRNVYRDQLFLAQHGDLKGWRCENIEWWEEEARGHFSHKDCLVYSYEDQEIQRVAHPAFETRHNLYLGKSHERIDVIIIRDPFNLLASRLKGNKPREKARNFNLMQVYSHRLNLPELWIEYAKECLGETQHLQNNKIVIKYNDWFANAAYRQQIAGQLGLEFSDEGFNEVTRAGGIGSSFDGTGFNGQVAKMDVLRRWKQFADDPRFRALACTPTLIDYSRKLFGHSPALEPLIEDLQRSWVG
ncbi:hypothetical protein [Acaryochloris marina]|uniref:hypothetical protein n=1 Tax=Acaryochloris marina TaxID=155978 RepID=UPI001BAF80FC|nr:hypothetical protein [Acaryochloris marina]QUY44827.1 hypothetical protein I1H34_12535 [Acaryochloris marina S15]